MCPANQECDLIWTQKSDFNTHYTVEYIINPYNRQIEVLAVTHKRNNCPAPEHVKEEVMQLLCGVIQPDF